MWPLEAKVLETPGRVARYVRDIAQEFLTCRYGPFADSGAMLAYLLQGAPDAALQAIENRLGSALLPVPEHAGRPSRRSAHDRSVPPGKPYPACFDCYHLILPFPGLRRALAAE